MLHATALKVTAMYEETPKPKLSLVDTKPIEERVDDMELANAYYINGLRLRMLAQRTDDPVARKRFMQSAIEDMKSAVDLLNREEEE